MNARFAILLGLVLFGGSIATLLVATTTAAIVIGGIGCSIGFALSLLGVLSNRWGRLDAALDFLAPGTAAHELPARSDDEPTALVG